MANSNTIGIVGLGYVGLPLAVAFGTKGPTIGFDLSKEKLAAYERGHDPSGEVSDEALAGAKQLVFSADAASLANASIIIVVVPTPIDKAKRPDLSPLESASRAIGPHLRPGTIVVYESTVYPGCTEEVCVPILEESSGLPWAGRSGADTDQGFYVGYSPERINPGDKVHRLETITKVVAGDTPTTLDRLSILYGSIIDAGIHRTSSIKVAEAAKVIENTQRDLNIALMNELAMIFESLNIDTLDVLEAAGSKWNFLPFKPGLVGGHCIGVDPYYLTYKAQSMGFHPGVILAGRRINDGISKFVAQQTVKQMASNGLAAVGAKVAVLGITFKENCADLRNSRVPDIVNELKQYGCNVVVHDPLAGADEASAEYGIKLVPWDEVGNSQAIVLAVPHDAYREHSAKVLASLLVEGGVLLDVKGIVDREQAVTAGLDLWRL